MTLRTRDNRDAIAAHLAFHLSAGVDVVIANDHRSVDGTRDVLEEYERLGLVYLIRRDDETFVPEAWVNEMARLAATELEADWVFHTDADEFWWPRGGDLKAVLRAVPERFGAVRGIWRHFAPRPDDGLHFGERMTVRVASHGPWRGVEHTFHPNVKIAHRVDPSTTVRRGNHDAVTARPLLRPWLPVEVLHFPLRTVAQARTKYASWKPVLDAGTYVASHVDTAVDAIDGDRFDDFYARYVVDDERLHAGLRDGTLSADTRLRDALRRLIGDVRAPLPADAAFLPRPGALEFPPFDVEADASLAADIATLADAVDRAAERVTDLERRLAQFERPSVSTLFRRTAGAR